MTIVLPKGHPSERLGVPRWDAEGAAPVRIGIVNIMPRLEDYEPSLLRPLSEGAKLVEPVFLRLASHAYQSSDHAHLGRFYTTYEAATAHGPLDGLIVTGAPVEELPFEAVTYWRELYEILLHARYQTRATLGLCWGGLALARMVGVEKRPLAKKLFGVFEDRVLSPGHELFHHETSFVCAHSRHSAVIDGELEHAERAGLVRALSRGELTGYSLFETPDGRFIGHLGHPEYEGERLAFEWNRDRALGRTDVDPPRNFDADAPRTTWQGHRQTLFDGFVARAAGRSW